MKKFTRSSHIEYTCPYFKIVKEEIEMPSGETVTHYIHHRDLPFVVILGFSGERVLVSRQWRPVLQDWNWEFPMGGVDKQEQIEVAAKRELLEETGYTCRECTEIGRFLVGAGHTDQRGIVCVAYDIQKTQEQELESAELIEAKLIPITNFEKMITEGTIIDGPTLSSWQLYKQKIVAKAYASYGHKKKK